MDEVLIFRLPNGLYAIDVAHVKEVISYTKINSVPNMKKSVVGIIDLRGEIITVFSLSRFYDLIDQDKSEKNIVILHSSVDSERFGMLVNQVYVVREIKEKEFEKLPDFLSSCTYGKGIIKTAKGIVIWIDIVSITEEVFK
ncbi:MAG: chemotaxis protein CheW [Minisyncoccus archaeiphilus]|jgi:purine-binding chemotaxis protein CheW|uniref:chemotaxis protein CheW n=1 Tax=Minisyncoccus archaeiphilus TaxID=3238481 RepID=UPI002B122C58|nr:MAG: chemotaxis protein CheW [Candidatus Parcubacteria bacterium]